MGIEWIKERKAFGRPLGSYEGIQFPLADLWAELEGVRMNVYRAAWEMDRFYTRASVERFVRRASRHCDGRGNRQAARSAFGLECAE